MGLDSITESIVRNCFIAKVSVSKEDKYSVSQNITVSSSPAFNEIYSVLNSFVLAINKKVRFPYQNSLKNIAESRLYENKYSGFITVFDDSSSKVSRSLLDYISDFKRSKPVLFKNYPVVSEDEYFPRSSADGLDSRINAQVKYDIVAGNLSENSADPLGYIQVEFLYEDNLKTKTELNFKVSFCPSNKVKFDEFNNTDLALRYVFHTMFKRYLNREPVA